MVIFILDNLHFDFMDKMIQQTTDNPAWLLA